MRLRFLLGPAGTGKTFLCLDEIRRALREDPEGPPLLFLAPKQATFQLERQLLGDPELPGYTRLQILSFERLAKFILDTLNEPPPPMLSDDGRTMVLRALLSRRDKHLEIFRASANLAGFARQLSVELRELQHHQLSPVTLLNLADRRGVSASLRHKLRDLSLLLSDYLHWLEKNNLQDGDCLLDVAAQALGRRDKKLTLCSEVWLDGFAEMTPQELALLAALAPFCQRMTLAFCLEAKSSDEENSWLSIWSGIQRTYRQCRAKFSEIPGLQISTDILPRQHPKGRFARNPVLRHLEDNWAEPKEFSSPVGPSLRVVACENPAAEAVLAARELIAFVRGGGRFREAAVLLRSLDGYHDELRRVFARYEIPFFLDRRQSVTHHPLVELTRSTLRAAARGWKHDDWFDALKSGLVSDDDTAIDRLENAALARGWKGEVWFAPFPDDNEDSRSAERLRAAWIAPFARFRKALANNPNGRQLAAALRALWRALDVENKLSQWDDADVHATVWTQMNAWLDNVGLAFACESLQLTGWLPILEAGLEGLTIGVVPPVLDQVLIGTIDRSRNPDLKLALLLGVNEKNFPALPAAGGLLSEPDREELRRNGTVLGHDRREFLSREQFFGYIACTRPSERLVVACAQRDGDDQPLNPSSFFSRLKNLFSSLEIETFSAPDWTEAEHASELVSRLVSDDQLLSWPMYSPLRTQVESFRVGTAPDHLSPGLAEQLYGPVLRTSVSKLEQFAACSFQFFVRSGLRGEERKKFELDVKERGTFQHEALAQFHRQLQAENKRWRDLTPDEARRRMGTIVEEMTASFRDGLMNTSAQSRFSARILAKTLQEFVAAMAGWMSQYEFDPSAVELGFGAGDGGLPAWELDLGGGRRLHFRGIIDRVDLYHPPDADEALAVVVDYKSRLHKLDPVKMAHGLQMQLTAYLGVLRHLAGAKSAFGVARLVPSGVFYVNLRGKVENGETRAGVLNDRDAVKQTRYRHSGRFDLAALPHLDNRGAAKGTQFNFSLKKNGEPAANNRDLLASAAFQKLLDEVEGHLVRIGREIYEGNIGLNPFQKGGERACDKCEFHAVCRFDSWIHPFRVLSKKSGETEPE